MVTVKTESLTGYLKLNLHKKVKRKTVKLRKILKSEKLHIKLTFSEAHSMPFLKSLGSFALEPQICSALEL